jgi:hypothetical protein
MKHELFIEGARYIPTVRLRNVLGFRKATSIWALHRAGLLPDPYRFLGPKMPDTRHNCFWPIDEVLRRLDMGRLNNPRLAAKLRAGERRAA